MVCDKTTYERKITWKGAQSRIPERNWYHWSSQTRTSSWSSVLTHGSFNCRDRRRELVSTRPVPYTYVVKWKLTHPVESPDIIYRSVCRGRPNSGNEYYHWTRSCVKDSLWKEGGEWRGERMSTRTPMKVLFIACTVKKRVTNENSLGRVLFLRIKLLFSIKFLMLRKKYESLKRLTTCYPPVMSFFCLVVMVVLLEDSIV